MLKVNAQFLTFNLNVLQSQKKTGGTQNSSNVPVSASLHVCVDPTPAVKQEIRKAF